MRPPSGFHTSVPSPPHGGVLEVCCQVPLVVPSTSGGVVVACLKRPSLSAPGFPAAVLAGQVFRHLNPRARPVQSTPPLAGGLAVSCKASGLAAQLQVLPPIGPRTVAGGPNSIATVPHGLQESDCGEAAPFLFASSFVLAHLWPGGQPLSAVSSVDLGLAGPRGCSPIRVRAVVPKIIIGQLASAGARGMGISGLNW